MKRYSLCAFDTKTKSEVLMGVNVGNNGIYVISGEKSLLSMIDIYTMQFDNDEKLLYDLLDIGVLDRDAKLYIRYENNGPKKTSILYKEAEKLLPFSKECSTNVATNTSHFEKILNQLLKSANNIKYINFMFKYGYINDYLYKKLIEYRNSSKKSYSELELLTTKISIALSSYKVIRDIYIGTKRYKNNEAIPNVEPISIIKANPIDNEMTADEKYQLDLYLHGGEDELYSIYDNDQISDKVLKKINEYHRKGL